MLQIQTLMITVGSTQLRRGAELVYLGSGRQIGTESFKSFDSQFKVKEYHVNASGQPFDWYTDTLNLQS